MFCTTSETEGEVVHVKTSLSPPVIQFLIFAYVLLLRFRPFQGGGSYVVSVSCFGVRVSVMFHFMFVHYAFSSVKVAEWPPFGK